MLWMVNSSCAQKVDISKGYEKIDVSSFWDSSHHWYDINDDDKIITPSSDQKKYSASDVSAIADNILLYQKTNGGWPKNYDMLAVLTDSQRRAVVASKNDINATTFDNGATHAQVEYLAQAYALTGDVRYRNACVRGIDFVLSAQYPNGGWPQFYPDTSGYRKYITFNDGAMIGVMNVLHHILQGRSYYSFVGASKRDEVGKAFERGLDCILKCQIEQNGQLTAWCQQHDNLDFHPEDARAFEPASICSEESAEIVLFLMGIDHPSKRVTNAIQGAVQWFEFSKIGGIRVEVVKAPLAHYKYYTTETDRVVVQDPDAPPIWTRLYELNTNRPLFCNRDRQPVYSLAEVDRERRMGYTWYNYAPAGVLKTYGSWQHKWDPDRNVLAR